MRSPLLVCLLVAAPAAAADLPPDLALVPPDAVGFIHIRAADAWADPAMASARRAVVPAAAARHFAALDDQFVPKPSTLDRLTLIVLPSGGKPPGVVGVARFKAAFDPASVAKAALPSGQRRKVGGREVTADPDGLAVHFPDDRTIVFGQLSAVSDLLTRKPGRGGLGDVISGAAGRAVTAAVDVSKLPVPADAVPPDLRPLLKARRVLVAVALGTQMRAEVRAAFPTPADAAAADAALRKAAQQARAGLAEPRRELEQKLGRAEPGTPPRPLDQLPEAVGAAFGLGGLKSYDALLADPPVRRAGAELAVAADLPPDLGGQTTTWTGVAVVVGAITALGQNAPPPGAGPAR